MSPSIVAALPWYDLPCVQWANDVLWQATGYPGTLTRDRTVEELWQDPDLLLTQACGLDLYLSDARIEPVAAPVFDLDCSPGTYYSYIVGRLDGRVAAVNSLSSHSGYTALLSTCSPDRVVVTGSHTASIAALKAGSVDVAAIDAVTWTILKRDSPEALHGLNVVERSQEAPSPPFVVRKATDREDVLRALYRTIASSRCMHARRALLLKDVVPAERDDYASILSEYLRGTHQLPA